MKKKNTAALAVVFLPLLVLSSGVIVASARRTPKTATTTAPGKASERIASFLSETKRAPAAMAPEAPKTPVDRAQIRTQVIACLERLRYVGRRSAECKELWPEASTEEEGRALQREKVALDAENQELYGRLRELAAQDPATIVDIVLTARELPERLRLMGLIAPDIDAEYTSEDGPSGPLLSRLLGLLSGDADERAHLAAFGAYIPRPNRDLGRALVQLLNDPDLHVRIHAANSLMQLSRWGSLREFLGGQVSVLMQAAQRNDSVNDSHTRGDALRTLAVLGVDEADQFLLQQFENLEVRNDYSRVEAVAWAAPRIAARYQPRLVLAILRALDLPFQDDFHVELQRIAGYLSAEQQPAVLAAIANRPAIEMRSTSTVIGNHSGRPQRMLMRVGDFSEERRTYPITRRRWTPAD